MKLFLEDLNTDIQKVNIPISHILKREGRGRPKSLLDKIYESEDHIKKFIGNLKWRMDFLKEKQIILDEKTLKKLDESIKELDYSELKKELNQCKNLSELANQASEVYRRLDFDISKKKDALNLISEKVYDYFEDFINIKNLNSLELIFKSLRMFGYENAIKSYMRGIKRLQENDIEIPFQEIINHLISHRDRIEEGHNKVLKEELSENAQRLYKSLYDKFSRKSYFSESNLLTLANTLKINEEELREVITELFNKNLIEKRFHFKS